MTLSLNRKEDLRLQMADLEKKLAESEEERFKLEKTCNVLMKAFREEEKIQYKALNKNYEKFLQDCSMRKRRNDIILRTLCKIEDRSKALFAKTERLKLLRDRYISYLKISGFKDGVPPHNWKIFPSILPQQRISNDHPKYVQWKTPLMTDHKIENLKDVKENSFWNNKTSDVTSNYLISDVNYRNSKNSNQKGSAEIQDYESGKINEANVMEGISHIEACIRSPNPLNKVWSLTEFNCPLGKTVTTELRSETINQQRSEINDIFKNNVGSELEVKDSVQVIISKEKNNLSHQESVDVLKKALSLEEEFLDKKNITERQDLHEKKILEKEETERNEKNPVKEQNNSHDISLPRINHYLMNSSSSNSVYEEEKQDNHENDHGREMKTYSQEENVSSHELPMGLDGVDYQNETYPESYYEQPVHHHNHNSIVSDVILEEDETEQDVEEEEKNYFDEVQPNQSPEDNKHVMNSWKESQGQSTFDNPQQTEQEIATNNDVQLMDRVHDMNEKAIGEVRNQESDSEKLSQRKQSEGSEQSGKLDIESLGKKNVRSNLIHLLESDSESFQIEHGDAVSANEDSDFDFSFH